MGFGFKGLSSFHCGLPSEYRQNTYESIFSVQYYKCIDVAA
jgi:hypothetical protein